METNSKYIKWIAIAIVCIIILWITFIINSRKEKEETYDDDTNTYIAENSKNTIRNFDDDFDIFTEEEQGAFIPYNDEHLNKFDFKLIGIPNSIAEKIQNMDEFEKQIKKYVYIHGLIENKDAVFLDEVRIEGLNDNEIAMRFLLNKENIALLVEINIDTGEINIKEFID